MLPNRDEINFAGMTISFIHILVSFALIFKTATAGPQERAHPPESAKFDTSAAASAAQEHGGAAEGGHDNIGTVILHHISDSHELELPFVGAVHLPRIELWGMDLSITKHVVMMMVAAVLLVLLLSLAARRRSANEVPTGFAAAIEAVVEFIRNEIAIPNMGEKFGILFTPYLCTAFFFILTCNLLGLVPYAATPTGNVSVTAALASLTFILTQAMGIKVNGIGGYLKHLTGGVHPAMWIIMIPVEFLGLFTKPFALCIRLYANMTAGHVVILSLVGLIFIFGKGGASPIAGYGIAPLSVAFSLFVNLLEILVAFLQAYIFTLLSALFIGFAAHSHHEEEGHEAQH
jgi:F-type H+-transporting ATPase subunit a